MNPEKEFRKTLVTGKLGSKRDPDSKSSEFSNRRLTQKEEEELKMLKEELKKDNRIV
ncbi:MAG: hypothetical protein WC884_00695 [Candidatus Paceibacterota bacterium]